MTKEDMTAMSWALNGNHLKVYPVRTKEFYNVMVTAIGKPRKTSKCYVKLCIEIGNGKHIGKELYKQELEMTTKIIEIYTHYYKQRKH
tara:strand:+ start:339 stop:602 length:264 start_codon:yes stop_codon:yes gene_type:complete